MGRLAGSIGYLCGCMDRVKDGGETWRKPIRTWLEERGAIVFDPTDKPIDIGIEDKEAREEINKLKEEGRFSEIREKYQDIASVDLRMVDLASWLVVYLDLDTHPCGTYNEIFNAIDSKKPVLIVVEQGKKNCPNWIFFRSPHEYIFSSFAELKEYLDYIDTSEVIDTKKRWRFFNLQYKLGV